MALEMRTECERPRRKSWRAGLTGGLLSHSLIRSSVAFGLVATLAACGGDSKGVTQPAPLSPADFTSMTDALTAIIGTSTWASGQTQTSSASRTRSADVDFSVSAQCPVGGTITFVGIVSASSSASHYAVTANLRGCAARGGNGEVWTFSTSQAITVTLDVARSSESTLGTGAETGTISWSNGTRNGSCAIDVTSSTLYAASNETYDILVNGVVCGTPVDKHTVVQQS